MNVITKEQYDKIPNGAILYIFLVGDEWENNIGEKETVIKKDDKLKIIHNPGYFYFSEKDEPNYEFIVAYKEDN